MDASQGVRHGLRDGSRERRGQRRLTLAIGLAVLAVSLVATLSHATERRTGTNGLPARVLFGIAPGRATICQQGERIPSGTAAIRISLLVSSQTTPRLAVELSRGDVVRATGAAGARWDRASATWYSGSAVRIPLAPTLRGDVVGDICIRLLAGRSEQYGLLGIPTALGEGATEDGRSLAGRLHVEYLAAGDHSWWSFAPTLVGRIGRGHAWSGPSVGLLVALLMLTPIALGAWQLSRNDS